ncbi:toxin glutamine deamidase domain-containing protein [Streptomyces monticola]|uniref:Toxin glutamine deamidase domain-containing protein n=1 Tax=Streptomyces monticola TaxID=2666263 RepID=A0ABW2JRS5_9ACTN
MAPTPTPNGQTPSGTPDSSPNGTQQPGPDGDKERPDTPRPASESRNSNPPGGVNDPTRAEQDNLNDSVPRDENGDPTRPPDPDDGPWVERINGEGRDAPGRNNNCVDTALSTVDTYAGNPTAAGARTPDPDADGNPSDRGEKGGRDRIENTLGAKFSDMGNGRDAFNRLENTLRQNGHGSQAVIITQDANGRSHAWNAVNHNGKITYIDAQTGQKGPNPLHSGNKGVFAIPLDANRSPVTPNTGDGRSDAGQQRGRNAPDRPGATARRPDAEPAGAPPDGKGDKDGKDGKDPDKPKYSDPHDRGDSNTSKESRRVTEDGPESDTSRTHEKPEGKHSKEYGLEPDELQRKLRQQRDVHRVELDRVHDRLDRWAGSGELAGVLRSTESDADGGPQRFTRSQLSESLDGFDQLSRGEQQAVVASIARLSLSFHEAHSVGANPESVEHPYRGPKEGEPEEGTKDRGAKLANESLGVKLHRMAVNKLFQRAYFKKLSDDNAEIVRDHGPDFSGKNFAVLEVQGPPPDNEVTYVVDSSVPANQNLPEVKPRHSERHLLDWLERVDPDGSKYTPLGLYTEREPCGSGQGHMKCSDVLLDKRFEGVPIHYSMTYREDPDGVKQRDQMMADKEQTLAELEDLSDKEIKQRMREEWSEKYEDDKKRLNRALRKLSGKSGDDLIDAVERELDIQRKENRTPEERAITEEFDQHIRTLRKVWHKDLLHQLIN